MKTRLNNKIIKIVALAAMFGTAFLPSAVSAAEPTWGPERDTYTMQVPANVATFNSITDNPTLGDERKFIRVAHIPSDCDTSKIDYTEAVDGADAPAPTTSASECVLDFKQSVEIEPGEQYMVYIYYHNNASSDLNKVSGIRGIAKNVKMTSSFPELILGARGEIRADISYTKKHEDSELGWDWDAEDSNVWAKAYLLNEDADQIMLEYVPGSAKHYNVGWLSESGKILPYDDEHDYTTYPMVVDTKDVSTALFTDGIYLGFADGISPSSEARAFGKGYVLGCEPYHGIVTYVLQSAAYSGEIEKQVSTDGGVSYKYGVTVEPGAEVTYRLAIRNTGQKNLTNVVVKDTLPEGMTLVPDSIEVSTGNSGVWDKQTDSTRINRNFGTINPNTTVYMRYKAKVSEDFGCDIETLNNVAELIYDGISSEGIREESSSAVMVRSTKEECEVEDKLTIKKEVSVNKGKAYKETAEILPGETVTFKIAISNLGTYWAGHITLKDVLPEGLTLVKDSAKWVKLDENGEQLDSGNAVNMPSFFIEVLAPGQSVEITYEAKAGEDFDCKGKELTNTATITYNGEEDTKTKSDTAKVTVKKTGEECVEPEKNCKTNPEMEECQELPDTGPVEIAIFSMIVLGITGGTVYLILAKRTLKKMTASVINEQPADPTITAEPTVSDKDKTDGGALNA